jgi:signal transduction histidine kinase/ligand-binding sensor domain-containing protein/AraC-like DNA-binding protein
MRKLIKIVLFLIFYVSNSFPLWAVASNSYSDVPPTAYNFWHLSVNNGLSQNSVTSIIQDSKGFIWIGTFDGLNRFDGISTYQERYEPMNINSLSDNRILSLYESGNGLIFIGTDGGGLNIFDPVKDVVTRLSAERSELTNNTINKICEDHFGNIWLGSAGGLMILVPKDKKQGAYELIAPKTYSGLVLFNVECDKEGNIWFGGQGGLFFSKSEPDLTSRIKSISWVPTDILAWYFSVCNSKNGVLVGAGNKIFEVTPLQFTENSKVRFKINPLYEFKEKIPVLIRCMNRDLKGDIWVGSTDVGLFKFEFLNNEKLVLTDRFNYGDRKSSLTENKISTLFVDRSNILWVGTYRKGVYSTNLSNKKFYSFNPLISTEINDNEANGKYITTTFEDNLNYLWFGTYEDGIFVYDKYERKLYDISEYLDNKTLNNIFQASDKTIWICGDAGLYKIGTGVRGFSVDNLRRKTFRVEKIPGINVPVYSLCEDLNGNIWYGTQTGVFCYQNSSKKIMPIDAPGKTSDEFTFLVSSFRNNPVVYACVIGGGIWEIKYNEDYTDLKFRKILHDPNNSGSLLSNHVWSLCRDTANILWVGTDAGLNRFVLNNKSEVVSISPIDNEYIIGRKIVSIKIDKSHNIWLGSSQGLLKFNPEKNIVNCYTFKDGLQSNTFTEGSTYTRDGWMYFGGINGLNFFRPEEIADNPFQSQIAILDLKIFGRTVKVGEKLRGKVVLSSDINTTDHLFLSHKLNNFTLSFAALHYANPEQNKFRYKLEHYDKDWIQTDYHLRSASYSNLPPGKYTFLIQSSNNDDVWNTDSRKIEITLAPPPWNTVWAYIAYFVTLTTLALIIISFYRTKQEWRQQLFLEKVEKEKINEINELKLSFFTNITHELRAPLNLIVGPIKDLSGKYSEADTFSTLRFQIVQKNIARLQNLINQILDFRKVSSNNMTLNVSLNNLTESIRNIEASFNYIAKEKNVDFSVDYEPLAVQLWYDRDKIEKIILNLLSNAFKFTKKGGKVSLIIETASNSGVVQTVTVTIKDTGVGMLVNEQSKIYEPFFQGKHGIGKGTGIGLSLSKSLVELHHGKISFESAPGEGTSFVFTFPVMRSEYVEHEINSFVDSHSNNAGITQRTTQDTSEEPESQMIKSVSVPDDRSNKFKVLIIEDDQDLRNYITDCLSCEFKVFSANDGIEGTKVAQKVLPNIIVSDLIMPDMDGIELCKNIKSNTRTSHIPVIIHSIKANNKSYQDAMEAGAHDFIGKPMDYNILIMKIRNILFANENLIAATEKERIITPDKLDVPSLEAEFLNKVKMIIEKHISDPSFGGDRLSSEMAMSRMQLHRKLHDILGKTTSELIREIKMLRAKQLLSTGSKRISEVMDDVGISSYSLFSKHFEHVFEISPKEFLKKTRAKNEIK